MKLMTFQYIKNKGWSIDKFPDLDSEQTLILVFAAPGFINSPEPIYELAKHYPKSKMIGCSSAGEILGADIYDDSLSVAVVHLEKSTIKITKIEIQDINQSLTVGETIAKQLDTSNLKSIFVLSKGLNVNGTELVGGLNKTKNKVIITGGLAGDGDQFKRTWTIFNGAIEENHIVAVGFYDKFIHIGHASRGGWDVFGPERIITRAEQNILYEFDNKPALTLYKEYLGEKASGLPATGLLYPLSIRKNEDDDRHLVRTILGIDEKEQALIFAGDIPQGYLAQLMRANFDRIITGANQAGSLAKASLLENNKIPLTSNPILCIAISCVGRRLLLASRTDEETAATLESLPHNTQQIGFYSYGELSPHANGACDLHNQTMTLTIIYEE